MSHNRRYRQIEAKEHTGPLLPLRRWSRNAASAFFRHLGKAFSAYPQGTSVGVVWYTGF